MKKLIILAALTLTTTLYAGPAAATPAKSKQVWKGNGEILDRSGRSVAKYRLVMTVTPKGAGRSERDVRIYVRGRQIKRMTCQATAHGRGWKQTCGAVRGGGTCFGDGLCMDYVTDGKGLAWATTIVNDGRRSMRLLRTELRHQKAVRFFRERLRRTR